MITVIDSITKWNSEFAVHFTIKGVEYGEIDYNTVPKIRVVPKIIEKIPFSNLTRYVYALQAKGYVEYKPKEINRLIRVPIYFNASIWDGGNYNRINVYRSTMRNTTTDGNKKHSISGTIVFDLYWVRETQK